MSESPDNPASNSCGWDGTLHRQHRVQGRNLGGDKRVSGVHSHARVLSFRPLTRAGTSQRDVPHGRLFEGFSCVYSANCIVQ